MERHEYIDRMMNDGKTKCEGGSSSGSSEKDDNFQKEKAEGILRDFLIRLGCSPKWGSLIAAMLGAGLAVLASLASSSCSESVDWRFDGTQGTIEIRHDSESQILVIEGKKRESVGGEEACVKN